MSDASEQQYTITLVTQHGKATHVSHYRTRNEADESWQSIVREPVRGWVSVTLSQRGLGAIRFKRFDGNNSRGKNTR